MNLPQISALAVLIPVAVGIWRWRKSGSNARLLTVLVLLSGCTELAAELLGSYAINFYFLIHIWILIEITLVTVIYATLLGHRKLATGIWGVFVLVGIIMEFAVAGPLTYPYLLRNIESVVIIVYTVYWFSQKMIREPMQGAVKTLGFWLATSHFVYFTGTFLLFNMVGYLGQFGHAIVVEAWNFHAIMAILMFLCYATALLCKEQAHTKAA